MKETFDLFKRLLDFLEPNSPFSWRTLLLLSGFSWSMAFLSRSLADALNTETTVTSDIISFFGWIFLIVGLDWWTMDHPYRFAGFSLGSWVTGALVCLFLYVFLFDEVANEVPSIPFVSWPIISALITVTHIFYPARASYRASLTTQRLIIIVLCHFLISCWIQFNFLIRDWLEDYPSLLIEDFARSGFVVELDSSAQALTRGEEMLNSIEQLVKTKVEGQPWGEAEQWLVEIQQQLQKKKPWREVKEWLLTLERPSNNIQNELQVGLSEAEEDVWWSIQGDVNESNLEYTLKLQAIWQGPRAKEEEYSFIKTCRVWPIKQSPNRATNLLPALPQIVGSSLECEEVETPFVEDSNELEN
ncbi:DUF5357 family protein [Microcoleus sp. FACHB-68]|uniref:DUF5357 family protein n=1 Tax=Microcoleus sp. FACHB-68 TaxID=2692826 RepID=UPI001689DB8A|nr:DUF5357 family protein [Microcoleus sp. FACHB-68]